MSTPLITIKLVVLNGEKYIRHCLDAVLAQIYPHELIKFNILDNGSTDGTKTVIENYKFKIENLSFSTFNLIESRKNLGMWPGQEELLKYSDGEYVLAMAVDVILDKDFIRNAVEIMEKDKNIGALQAKIYKFDIFSDIQNSEFKIPNPNTIDTCGFQIYKSRRLTNMGHGEKDAGQFNQEGYIFGVEGTCPFFRREALESCGIKQPTNNKQQPTEEIFDHDFFWYGDDFDLAWRMNLFGWKQIFAPNVMAWHDRQTTKTLKKNYKDFIKIRKKIPIKKRGLDWKNSRFTIIKNDYIINVLKDLPWIFKRELMLFGYIAFFEPKVLLEIPVFLKMFPKMLGKRKEVMKKATVPPAQIHKWFQ